MNFSAHNNIQDCLEAVQNQLNSHELYYGHGTDNAWDEACWLVETLLKRHGVSDFKPDTPLNKEILEQIELILRRRIEETLPLAYLLHEAWFAGLPFYVDERVLVPRSPIAELIANQFSPLLKTPPRRILDLCTGSGCIGIACAMTFEDADVELADLSTDALVVANKNIEKYQLGQRVMAIESDLFENLGGTYDLIVSNPPYVSQEEYDELPCEYFQEPHMGLVSESNGLAIPTQIIYEAAQYLSEEGVLILEVGNSWQALAESLPEVAFLWLEFEFGGEGVCMLTAEQLRSLK